MGGLPEFHFDRMVRARAEYGEMARHFADLDQMAVLRALSSLAGENMSGGKVMLAMSEYLRWGRHVYCLGPRMQGLFSETEIDGIPRQFFRLPVPGFYVALASCGWRVWGGPDTGMHDVGGAYVHCAGSESLVQFLVWGKENERSWGVGDDATFWFTVDLNACPKADRGGIECLDLDACIMGLLDGWEPSGGGGADPEAVKAEHVGSIQKVLRVVACLILYLNSDEPEVERDGANLRERAALERHIAAVSNPKKRRVAQRRLEAISDARVTWIGRQIEREEAAADERDAGDGRKIRRHLVRGHFHSFWIGPRRDDSGQRVKGTRLVHRWMRPHWAGGGEQSEGPTRVVRLKEDRQDG